MKLLSAKRHYNNIGVVGHTIEIADDRQSASVMLNAEGTGGREAVRIWGTPREIRALARSILEGLREECRR